LSKFKKYHPSGNLKLNYLRIFQSLKFRILMEKILSISLKLNFNSNTLECHGLKSSTRESLSLFEIYHMLPTCQRVAFFSHGAGTTLGQLASLNILGFAFVWLIQYFGPLAKSVSSRINLHVRSPHQKMTAEPTLFCCHLL